MSLIAEPELRSSAQKMLESDWLKRKLPNNYKMYIYNEIGMKENMKN